MSRSGGGCKVIVMLFVGIFIGILLTVGGLVGAGFWAYNNISITKIEQMLGTKIINLGEYNDKPIKDLVTEFNDITNLSISEIDDKLLEGNIKKNFILKINDKDIDLSKTLFSGIMSAKISTVTDELGKIKDHLTFGLVYNDILIEGGVNLPKDSPFALKFKDRSLEDTLSNYKAEKISTLFEDGHDFGNDMVQAVFDAIKEKNLTFEDLSSEDKTKLNDAIDSIKVNDVLSLDGTGEGLLGELANHNYTLGDLKENDSYDALSINNILGITSSSTGVLAAIGEKNWTLGHLKDSDNFKTLKLGKILDVKSTDTGILKAMENWTLGELNNAKIKTLTLSTVLELNGTETGILAAMSDWTLAEINEAKINTLKLKEIIDINDASSKILKSLQNSTISSLSTDIDSLRLDDVMDLGIKDYKTDPALAEPDSYTGFIGLLYETDSNVKGPLISNLSNVLNNIHVNTKKLGELQARGLINTSSTDLDKTLGSKKLKEYTIEEVINYVVALAS